MKLPVPIDTQSVLKDNNMLLKTSNLGLLFNKYIYSWQNGWKMEEKDSKEFRHAVSKRTQEFVKEHIANLAIRQQATLQSMKSSGWQVESFNATTDSRLIIGLGGTSVIETGMTLHPLYGFPYLPGSGLKGLARAYAEIAENFPNDETKKNLLLEIFGSMDKTRHSDDNRQGKVFFMDGLPTTFPKLDLDIMNPHYSEYYQGNKPPADYLNPVPITFLAVAKGRPFSFAVFSRDKALADKAKSWLIGGLTDLGAGGKTNVGYGYFSIDESNAHNSGTDVQPSSTTRQTTTIASETIIWGNAILTWSPGNQTLKAEKDGKKAELKVQDRGIVPESLHKGLFDKREPVRANVTVEKTGSAFKIVRISL